MIVVDSQGNEYEATYPKRAKGLVKSGRARFVAENKICLACPPSDKLEDKIMENNTKVEAAATVQDELGFTTKDIFEQIKVLQNELAEKHSLFSLDEALLAVFSNTEFEDDQAKSDAVSNITAVFAAREESLRYLLSMYKELLNIIIFNLK